MMTTIQQCQNRLQSATLHFSVEQTKYDKMQWWWIHFSYVQQQPIYFFRQKHRTHNSSTISQHSLFRILLHHPNSSEQINYIVHHYNSPYIDHNANNIIVIIAGCETFWSGYKSLIMSRNMTYYSKNVPIHEWLSHLQTLSHSEQPYSNHSGVRD